MIADLFKKAYSQKHIPPSKREWSNKALEDKTKLIVKKAVKGGEWVTLLSGV